MRKETFIFTTKNFSFKKFLAIFSAYLLFVNFAFFKGVFDGFLEQNSLIFSAFFTGVLAVAFLALLCVIICLFFVPFLLKPLAILVVLISSTSLFFILKYGVIIDKGMLLNVLNTDTKEAFSYFGFDLFFSIIFGVILPIIFLIFIKLKYENFKTELKIKAKICLFCIIVFALIFALSSKIFIPFFREHKELRFYTLPFYPIYSSVKLYTVLTQKPLVFLDIADDAIRQDEQKKIFVLVVGETQRSQNYSLNGYTKNDTNFYTKHQNVASFSQFYSCGTSTIVSVPCMFSDLKRTDYDARVAKSRANLTDFTQKVGIKTFWFGNNSGGCQGVCERIRDVIDLRAASYDDEIFNEAKNTIKSVINSTFIILHIQGSHGPVYFKGYPDEFKKFRPTCDTAELNKCDFNAILNTYDNTILYQDFLQNELINALKERENEFETAMFFVSDHGESLGENGIYLHGLPYAIAPNVQKHVPAIIYLSDKTALNRLKMIRDKELSHDYVFSSVLGFFDIKTKFYDEKLDIFRQP
ncbi:membrane protein [Campylobacter mucosalis]|uniref:phosphoethanolamine transferase n=1 Tax=Campylobacter mucosalis TaxID=202 RepID=UPI0004D9E47F|nr:phosphoethanolamine--lipid A transferase [Campylobacter mucosalis]KEA45749.1 membrane protein [Campylobacter mucosalis]QKF63382.1 phosphoethanolamine transferase [Campylobacter mucosalis]